MSRELIESILSNNMLQANDMVEAKMAEIRERKMYEMKRMYAARMDEIFGALTKADIKKRREAGYKKASEVLGDPREKERKSPRLNPKAKILKHKVSEEVLDEAGLGDAARKVHSMTDAQKQLFKSAMKGSVGDALRLRKALASGSKDKEEKDTSTIAGRLGKEGKRWSDRLDKLSARHLSRHDVEGGKSTWERSAGGKISSVVKPVVKTAGGAVGALGKELGSIGFSNLE